MKILAWLFLGAYSIKLIGLPFLIGKPKDWSWSDFWITAFVGPALYIPMMGRILGWW